MMKHMKRLSVNSLFVLMMWSAHAAAVDYPERYIREQQSNAKAVGVVDAENILPGKSGSIDYIDNKVTIYRRTAKDLEYLKSATSSKLVDPQNATWKKSVAAFYTGSMSVPMVQVLLASQLSMDKYRYRSANDEFFVFFAISPASHCTILLMPTKDRVAEWAPFLDPCYGLWFDVAGRVLKPDASVSAKVSNKTFNLFAVPHTPIASSRLAIGLPPSTTFRSEDVTSLRNYDGLNQTEKLMQAARYDDLAVVKKALAAGANANWFIDGKGSPLDMAIMGGNIEIIELLVASGARPTRHSRNVAKAVNRPFVLEMIERLEKDAK
jgi:hypothetical protein